MKEKDNQEYYCFLFTILCLLTLSFQATAQSRLSVAGDANIQGRLELSDLPGDSASIFIGLTAGINDEGYQRNTFIGARAGFGNTLGRWNTFVGSYAGLGNTTGHSNTFLGVETGAGNGLHTRSTHIGYRARGFSSTQDPLDRAISIGYRSRVGCSNCAEIGGVRENAVKVGIGTAQPADHLDIRNELGNVGMRLNAQDGSTSHLKLFENVEGYGFEFLYDGQPDKLYLWSRRFSGNEAIRMTWLKNGDVGIGTTTPAKRLDVVGEAIIRNENKLTTFHSTGANAFVSFENNGGTAGADVGYFNDTNDEYFFVNTPGGNFGELVINGSNIGLGVLEPAYQLQLSTNSAAKPVSSTWTIASDKRLKKNITPFTDGLAVLSQIEPVWYEFNGKAGLDPEGRHIGILAQDMQRIAPYTIGKHIYKSKTGAEEYLNFDANALFYIIINAVKEQEQEIEQKEEQIERQAAEIRYLRSELGDVQAKLQTIQEQIELFSEDANRHHLVLEREAYLSQNQPNPFHRKSLIKYFIPRDVKVAQLELTNELGRSIVRLTIPERGKGEVLLKANTYPAGTYFYTLILDGQAFETKKMILTY